MASAAVGFVTTAALLLLSLPSCMSELGALQVWVGVSTNWVKGMNVTIVNNELKAKQLVINGKIKGTRVTLTNGGHRYYLLENYRTYGPYRVELQWKTFKFFYDAAGDAPIDAKNSIMKYYSLWDHEDEREIITNRFDTGDEAGDIVAFCYLGPTLPALNSVEKRHSTPLASIQNFGSKRTTPALWVMVVNNATYVVTMAVTKGNGDKVPTASCDVAVGKRNRRTIFQGTDTLSLELNLPGWGMFKTNLLDPPNAENKREVVVSVPAKKKIRKNQEGVPLVVVGIKYQVEEWPLTPKQKPRDEGDRGIVVSMFDVNGELLEPTFRTCWFTGTKHLCKPEP